MAESDYFQLLQMVSKETEEEIGGDFSEEELKQVFSPIGSPHFKDSEDENEHQNNRETSNYFTFAISDHDVSKGKHGKKLYNCGVCSATYKHSFSLKRHFIRTHINYAYLNDTDITNCGINLSSSASLQCWIQRSQIQGEPSHEDSHLKGLYCCHSCLVFYSSLSGIRSHVDSWHRNRGSGALEPVRIPCQFCDMTFIQRHNLMRHITIVHQNNGQNQWDKNFRKPSNEVKSSYPMKQAKRTKYLSCNECPFNCSSNQILRTHYNNRHKEIFYPCTFCEYFSSSKKQLTDHFRSIHFKFANVKNPQIEESILRPTRVKSSNFFQDESAASVSAYGNNCNKRTNINEVGGNYVYSRYKLKEVSNDKTNSNYCSKEEDFYKTLSQNISENLLFHVDGRPKNIESTENKASENNIPLDLSAYNIPTDFFESENYSKSNLMDVNLKNNEAIKKSYTQLKGKCNEAVSVYICNVCGCAFDSPGSFDQHELNNHPNVECTYMEVDPVNLDAFLENFKRNNIEDVIYFPTKRSENFKCTKCNQYFTEISYLHRHILECASLSQVNELAINQPEKSINSKEKTYTNRVIKKITKIIIKKSYNTRSADKRRNHNSKCRSLVLSREHGLNERNNNKRLKNFYTSKLRKGACSNLGNKLKHLGALLARSVMARRKELREKELAKCKKVLMTKKVENKKEEKLDREKKVQKTNPLKSNKDNMKRLKRVKNLRKCPKCSKSFRYLANFRKHLKIGCSVKLEEVEKKDTDTNSEPDVQNNDSEKNGKEKLDLWKVKKEYPLYAFKGSPAQHHSCPYCRRGFTYLANFRRHTHDECPVMQQDALKKLTVLNENSNSITEKIQPSTSSEENLKDGIKSEEIEKNEMKENKSDGYRFKTYSCNVCHKIYFSYILLLRHQLSHKLSGNGSPKIVDEQKEGKLDDDEQEQERIEKESEKTAFEVPLSKNENDLDYPIELTNNCNNVVVVGENELNKDEMPSTNDIKTLSTLEPMKVTNLLDVPLTKSQKIEHSGLVRIMSNQDTSEKVELNEFELQQWTEWKEENHGNDSANNNS